MGARPDEVAAIWRERWGGMVVTPYRRFFPDDVDGSAAHDAAGAVTALVTWFVDG